MKRSWEKHEVHLREENVMRNATLQIKEKPSIFSDKEILGKVTNYYHRIFEIKSEGREYLASRGITKEEIFAAHRVGYVNGTLLNVLPKEEAVYEQLIRLGVLLENKKERFLNCVVFPLFNSKNEIASFYGRHIHMPQSGHFYLPGKRKSLFNLEPLAAVPDIEKLVIAESIIDALSFIEHKIENVLPIYGTQGCLAEHLNLIAAIQPQEIIIALDGDESGQKGAAELKTKFLSFFTSSAGPNNKFNYTANKVGKCKIVTFPNSLDANEYFKTHSKEDFYQLAAGNKVISDYLIKEAETTCTKYFKIKHTELKNGKLTVTIKAENPKTKRFLLDTYNLYSEKQRQILKTKLSELYNQPEEEIEEEITALIKKAELKCCVVVPESEENKELKLSEAEEQEAVAFLKAPDLLAKIVRDYEEVGYIGEETNKKIAYLVMTSRKMKSPLSLVIMANSAAGKSSLQKATLEFCPESETKHFTRLTQQSLYYLGEESLKHKFLSIEEEEGSSEASYSLKVLLSAKKLNVATTTQDPNTGRRKAEEYKTEGPVAVMVSTTSPDLEAELATRTIIISIDESKNQTQRIHKSQRSNRTLASRNEQLKKEKLIKLHQNAQKLLDSNIEVINNYADSLTFPIDRLKYRRGNEQYLDLIDVIAFLRQYQKEIKTSKWLAKYIEVEKKDIELASKIFIQVMGWSIDELKPPSRKLLKDVVLLCREKGSLLFTRKELREKYKWDNATLHRHLNMLIELDYVQGKTIANGLRHQYELIYDGDGESKEKFVLGLKDSEKI